MWGEKRETRCQWRGGEALWACWLIRQLSWPMRRRRGGRADHSECHGNCFGSFQDGVGAMLTTCCPRLYEARPPSKTFPVRLALMSFTIGYIRSAQLQQLPRVTLKLKGKVTASLYSRNRIWGSGTTRWLLPFLSPPDPVTEKRPEKTVSACVKHTYFSSTFNVGAKIKVTMPFCQVSFV